MAKLDEIVKLLNCELSVSLIPDYSNAHNGLQVENSGKVMKVAAAVDASLEVIKKAVENEVDLLVVHHGLFWQGVQQVKGAWKQKLELLLNNDIAVYSSHIPLDVHPEYGNSPILANKLKLTGQEQFFPWKGIQLGVSGSSESTFTELVEEVTELLGARPHFSQSSDQLGKVGVITGGAGSEVQAVAKCGIGTFITGEGQHWTYYLAKELNINLIYAGHYLTETFGVDSVCKMLTQRFEVSYLFLEDPSGL